MKNILLLLFTLLCYFQKAQITQTFNNPIKGDTCLDRKISVVFYLIQDSAATLQPTNVAAMNDYSLTFLINQMNAAFSPICVTFEHCKTVIIPNYPYNQWRAQGTGSMVVTNWFTDKTLNIYIPEEIVIPRPESQENGYAYTYPTNSSYPIIDAVVIGREETVEKWNFAAYKGSPLMHALGHYFGLPHTYAEINPSTPASPPPPTVDSPTIATHEFVDRSNFNNCHTHGDGFCDTDADPYPSMSPNPGNVSAGSCGGSDGTKDGKGNYYRPPAENFMSHYMCRCRFSKEQLLFMARYIATKRSYLH